MCLYFHFSEPEIMTALLENTPLTTNDMIGIQYTAVLNYFDHYKFTLVNNTHTAAVIKSRDDTDRVVTFNGLMGGSQYLVQVVTVSGIESSEPMHISILTGRIFVFKYIVVTMEKNPEFLYNCSNNRGKPRLFFIMHTKK